MFVFVCCLKFHECAIYIQQRVFLRYSCFPFCSFSSFCLFLLLSLCSFCCISTADPCGSALCSTPPNDVVCHNVTGQCSTDWTDASNPNITCSYSVLVGALCVANASRGECDVNGKCSGMPSLSFFMPVSMLAFTWSLC